MSEMNYTQAADEARRLLRGFTAMHELAAALEQAGALEARVAEYKGLADKMAGDIDSARAQLLGIRAQADEAVEEAARIAAAAKDDAESIVSQAKFDAEIIRADAKAHATALVDTATSKRDEIEREVLELMNAATDMRAEAKALEDRIEAARTQMATMLQV